MSLSESFNLADSSTTTGTFSATVSEAINLVDTVRIFVPPIPPTPTPQPGGGGSGGNAGGAHRQVRPSGNRHRTTAERSNQHPDNSLPESRSDFRKIERQIATDRDDDEILEILGMFLSVKDRRE